MRVMITGATGFVGYHTTQALLEAGHEVSLLVRSIDKMLNLYGEKTIKRYTRGDIADPASVKKALRGCDAVVHAAAMVATGANDADRVYRGNVEGARTVIGAAVKAGVESIVHVSSVTALFDPTASVLDENSPPGSARNAYGRSKVACEHYVRSLQDEGAPLYITYPATVMGPDDPGLTEAHVGFQAFLKGVVPRMPGGNQYVDVRDVARVHLALLEQQPADQRFTLGGHFLSWPELGAELEALTGRRFLQVPVAAGVMRLLGKTLDRVRQHVPIDLPISEEAMEYATQWVEMDNSLVENELAIELRPVADTLRDTAQWMLRAGHITPAQAGRLAAEAAR